MKKWRKSNDNKYERRNKEKIMSMKIMTSMVISISVMKNDGDININILVMS